MKKIIALILATIMLISLVGCDYIKHNDDTTPPEQIKIRIGYMAGPTGMGMAKLIHDNGGLDNGNEKYSFTKYADTNAAKADLAAGNIDIICLPTNEAAQYVNTIDNDAKVLAINCLNSLYLLTSSVYMINSLSELDGQTVYTCKNGTPRIILQHIIDMLGLNIKVSYEIDGKEIVTPQDLSTCVVLGLVPNAVMPEPVVTSALLTIAKNDTPYINYTVDINLADEWDKIYDTPLAMGCIVADGDFATYHKDSLNAFLQEYKESVEYIGNIENIDSASNYVVETGVMAAAPAARKALSNLSGSIAYMEGETMKTTLKAFYAAIGIALPDDSFYYEK